MINGSESHPGATHYVDKLSINKLPPARKARISISRKLPSSRGAVTEPGKSSDCGYEGKIVYRHLQDGDVVLVNRQVDNHLNRYSSMMCLMTFTICINIFLLSNGNYAFDVLALLELYGLSEYMSFSLVVFKLSKRLKY